VVVVATTSCLDHEPSFADLSLSLETTRLLACQSRDNPSRVQHQEERDHD